MTKQKIATYYCLLGLLAFGILGLEWLVLIGSTFIDGRNLSQFGMWPIHWYGAVAHFVLTISLWLILAKVLWISLKKRNLGSLPQNLKLTKTTLYHFLLSIIIVVVYTLLESLISSSSLSIQVIGEYKEFVRMYGEYGFIVTLFQVLYYFTEMILVLLIIISFQHLGETVFTFKQFPYGSIGLMITWGMIHFISHPDGALLTTIWALLPGLVYVFSKKSLYLVYFILILGFII